MNQQPSVLQAIMLTTTPEELNENNMKTSWSKCALREERGLPREKKEARRERRKRGLPREKLAERDARRERRSPKERLAEREARRERGSHGRGGDCRP